MTAAERAVLRELLRRELGERTRGSVLGGLWLLLLPLLQLAVLAWVFGHLLPARADSGSWPYAVFLALGLWPWNLLASALGRGTVALTDNAALIGKVALAYRHYIDARVAASVLVETIGLLLVLLVLTLWGMPLHAKGWLWLLPVLLLIALQAWAMATMLAVAQVFLRDIAASIAYLLTLGFFLTPVLYDRRELSVDVAALLSWNPLAAPIEALRDAFAGHVVAVPSLVYAAAVTLLLVLMARVLLMRARAHLEDFL